MEHNELEETTQETVNKKGLTNENKVSIFLLAVAAIVWIFVPFFKGDLFRVTAMEMVFGPVFQSWSAFAEAYFGELSYDEYVKLMSQSREFWIVIATAGCVLLSVVASLRGRGKYAFVFSMAGIVAFIAPMLEIVFYMIKNGFMISANLWLGLFSAFDWGYWAIAVIFVVVAVLNRKVRKTD